MRKIKIIAHRGKGPTSHLTRATINLTLLEQPDSPRNVSDLYLPENTIVAFQQAITEGAHGVELDVFLSSDRVPMVIHDNELNRNVIGTIKNPENGPYETTGYIGLVSDHNAQYLQTYNVGQNNFMPTLEEVIQLICGTDIILNIELKNGQNMLPYTVHKIVMNYIKYADLTCSQIVYCSFEHEALKQICSIYNDDDPHEDFLPRVAPALRTVQLFGEENVDPGWVVVPEVLYNETGIELLHNLHNQLGIRMAAYDAVLWDINEQLIGIAQQRQIGIHASTSNFRVFDVNSPFLQWLVDLDNLVEEVFFKTDEPGQVIQMLDHLEQPDLNINLTGEEEYYENHIADNGEMLLERLFRPYPENLIEPQELMRLWDENLLHITAENV